MRAKEHQEELKQKRPLWKKSKSWSATTYAQSQAANNDGNGAGAGQPSFASRTSTARQLIVDHMTSAPPPPHSGDAPAGGS